MTAADAGVRPGALTVIEAHALAAAVRLGLRCCSLRRVALALAAIPASRRQPIEPVPPCLAAARAAASRLAHSTCLFESLVAFGLLVRRGYGVELHLGARRGEAFESHAWLTVGGRTCEPEMATGYTEMWRAAAGSTRR
jgi:hypothetical protein